VQVAYAIGVAEPTSLMVTTFGTGKVADDEDRRTDRKHFDLRPKGIIQMLDLLRPIYMQRVDPGGAPASRSADGPGPACASSCSIHRIPRSAAASRANTCRRSAC
jgi:hypothetical protein